MPLASTSTVQLSYLEETTFGTVETGAPKKLRMTGEDLKYEITSESTKEINDTRQMADSVHISAEASGPVNIEPSYREYDPFLEALLGSTFNTFGTGGVKSLTVTIDESAGTITDDGTDGFAGLVAGQWFLLTTTLNTGAYRIGSMTDDQITVDAQTPLVVDETSVSADVSSTRLTVGTAALRYFSMQKAFTDVNQFFMFRGMCPTKLDLSFEIGAIVTGSIGFIGKDSVRAGSTQFSEAATASQTYGILNSANGVGATAGAGAIIARDSSANNLLVNSYVSSLSLSVDGKVRGQKAIGSLGNVAVAPGTFEIGGTAEVYLADGAIYDEALANNLVSIQFPVKDVNNNGYAFIFNNCKLGVPSAVAAAKDGEAMLSIPFTAVAPDTSSDKMLIIDRFGAAIS